MILSLVFIMLVVFTRFASAVIYFHLLLWHLLFKLVYSLHFVECYFFSVLRVVGLSLGDIQAFVFLLQGIGCPAGFQVCFASPA